MKINDAQSINELVTGDRKQVIKEIKIITQLCEKHYALQIHTLISFRAFHANHLQ